jgi:hypothetical protein
VALDQPGGIFRRRDDYLWRARRFFQPPAVVVSTYTGFRRRHTLDRFAAAPLVTRPRRYSPLGGVLYWGSVSLLWGV